MHLEALWLDCYSYSAVTSVYNEKLNTVMYKIALTQILVTILRLKLSKIYKNPLLFGPAQTKQYNLSLVTSINDR